LHCYKHFAQLLYSSAMQEVFETIVTGFLDTRVGLANNFLSHELAKHLRSNLLALHAKNRMQPSGIGNNTKLVKNELIRSDLIYWLDLKHDNTSENAFLGLIEEFVTHLNRTCYAGITGYEFHYTLYDKGTFYKRHSDQFHDNKNRAFTMIIYLNIGWKIEDGGQLCIYHLNEIQTINPIDGSCVFFKSSELEHEVLLSNTQRLSITGWLKTN
jgi:SM-20-related protein